MVSWLEQSLGQKACPDERRSSGPSGDDRAEKEPRQSTKKQETVQAVRHGSRGGRRAFLAALQVDAIATRSKCFRVDYFALD